MSILSRGYKALEFFVGLNIDFLVVTLAMLVGLYVGTYLMLM